MTTLSILAIIPARGGSKGLPGKNIRPLAGLPLLVHSLRYAALCPEITRCVVSTDDPRIAEVARSYGGEVPFIRPAELATDDAPTMPVLRHALSEMERRTGAPFDLVCLLEPTGPLRLVDDMARAVRLITQHPDADGVVSVSEPSFNPYYVGVVERNGYLAPAFDGDASTRRQDAPRFLRLNGVLYLWRRAFVMDAPVRWTTGRHVGLEIEEERVVSIDTLQEFQIAEALLEKGLVRMPWLEHSS